MRPLEAMRVLISSGIFPPDRGGPATYVPEIAGALTKRGHDVCVFTLADAPGNGDQSYPFRVERERRGGPLSLRVIRTLTKLSRLGRETDVVFANGLALEATLAAGLNGKPVVLKIVGDFAWERATNRGWISESFDDFQSRYHPGRIEVLKMLRSWWARKAKCLIAPSEYVASFVANWGVPRERIRVIYNAVELPQRIRPARIPLPTAVNVITLGRLVPWKHVDLLISAVRKVDGLGLVIVGDGPETPRLQSLCREIGVGGRVCFLGEREREEALSFLCACDFLALASSYEGLPHVVLEAMALGVPVVATSSGGTSEVVSHGESGLLVEPGDRAKFVRALQMLKGSAALRRRLSGGARAMAQRFAMPRMLAETESLLISETQRR